MEDGDCVVCYNPTMNVCKPCGHSVCRVCLGKWFARDKISCPYCTRVIAYPTGDEMDITVNDIVIDIQPHVHAGITLQSYATGVKVTKLTKNDKAYISGVRVGMIITHINMIPVKVALSATNIIQVVKQNGGVLIFTVLHNSEKPLSFRNYIWNSLKLNCSHRPRRPLRPHRPDLVT